MTASKPIRVLAMISDFEAEVLRHASDTGRYVTSDPRVLILGERGLLYDHGAQELAGGAHYLVMTVRGRQALNGWQAAQPKPKVNKRLESREFRAWRDYRDAGYHCGFSDFHKQIWPSVRR